MDAQPKPEFSSCLNELFDCSQEGIVLLRSDGSVLWHNRPATAMLGQPEDLPPGFDWRQLFSLVTWQEGEGEEYLLDVVDGLTREGGHRQGVCSIAGAGGGAGTFLCVAQRLNSGPLAGHLLLRFTDLTLLRKVEESGRALEGLTADVRRHKLQLEINEECFRRLAQEYQALLDGIPDILLHFSAERRVLWGNRAAISRFGEEHLVGMGCHAALTGQPGECQHCPLDLCRKSGLAEVGQVSTEDGRFLEFRAFPIFGEDMKGAESFLLLQRDLTDQVRLQERTVHSNHLASMGELAAGVAHEINNPVTGIINCGQLLYDTMAPASPDREVAQRIIREGERISAIVRNLLCLARIEREKREGIRVEEELRDLLALTRAQLRKERVIVTIRIAPDLPTVIANPQQIRQVFLNIINNARYALNEKYPEFSEEKVLEIRGESLPGGGGVRFSFLDFGIGIPEAIRDRIFHPFFTTKPVGHGTGLGLSISHSIIADHGGRLLIDSIEGEYTRVTIELPGQGKGEGG